MAKNTNELADQYGEAFVKLSVTKQECNALWYLINLQYNLLVKEKKITGTRLIPRWSSAQRKYASCRSYRTDRRSELTFAPENILRKMAKDPMELMTGVFYTVAHELGHHIACQRYGDMERGHGYYWKKVMWEEFGVDATRIHLPECNQKPPKIRFQQERLWDMWDLYQTWRLEGPDWNDPLVNKVINGNYEE